MLSGRDFSTTYPSEPEIIIDRPTAHLLFPNSDPIGAHVKLGALTSTRPWARVVGIAVSTGIAAAWDRYAEGKGTVAAKTSRIGVIYYLPTARDSFALLGGRGRASVEVVVRLRTDPTRGPIMLRRVLRQVESARLIYARSMEDRMGLLRERQSHDFVATTFFAFAALAVGLVALGIYGIVSHSVAERRRELGVRIALGASARHILKVVLREGNVLALAGSAVGLWCTKETAGWLRAFSFEEDQYEAPVFAAMALVLFAVAVAAALIPALRATRIDPVESLRSE